MGSSSGGAPRMGTHATDWIMSWCTLTALARRASSRALVVTTGSPVAMTCSATEREKRACGSSPLLSRAACTRARRPRRDEHHEAALAAEERDGVIGDAREEPRESCSGRCRA